MKNKIYLTALAAAAASELSAGTIAYAPANGATAVPMSTEGLVAMAGLFLALGIWMLVKSRKGMGSVLVLAGVLTGFYPAAGDAAMASTLVELTNPSGGTVSFNELDPYIEVRNISGVTVTITDIQPGNGAATSNQCTVGIQLANNASCQIFNPN